jgi:hypothetical protein
MIVLDFPIPGSHEVVLKKCINPGKFVHKFFIINTVIEAKKR